MSGRLGHIHAGGLHTPRLQRVLALMRDGQPRTTRAIVRGAKVMAVNAVISELRHHGAEIVCVRQIAPSGIGTAFYYTMTKAPSIK